MLDLTNNAFEFPKKLLKAVDAYRVQHIFNIRHNEARKPNLVEVWLKLALYEIPHYIYHLKAPLAYRTRKQQLLGCLSQVPMKSNNYSFGRKSQDLQQ